MYIFTFRKTYILSLFSFTLAKANTPEERERYHTWYFHSLMTSTFGAIIFWRHFTWSAPPLLYSWSHSPIGCSTPLYSWSSSLIWSAYYFLYISFCFTFNKSLTNLTLLRQHHLQYSKMMFGNCSKGHHQQSQQLWRSGLMVAKTMEMDWTILRA